MGDYGRIQALILANLQGHVVYERFYSAFTDLERADLRSAMQVPSLLRSAAAWHHCGNLCLSAPAHACRPGPGSRRGRAQLQVIVITNFLRVLQSSSLSLRHNSMAVSLALPLNLFPILLKRQQCCALCKPG